LQQNAASGSVIPSTQCDISDTLQNVYRHWNTKFCGHAKLALQEKLLEYENSIQHYHQIARTKIIPIIQSSGMGKSRLIDEISKSHLTILFTFRKNGESGFPLGDPEITHFVDKALSWKSDKSQGSQEEVMMAHSYALALILGALRTLSKWLKRRSAKTNKGILPQGDIAREWYQRMVPSCKDVEINTSLLSDMIAITRSKQKIKFCHETIQETERVLRKLTIDKEWQTFFLPEVSTSSFPSLKHC